MKNNFTEIEKRLASYVPPGVGPGDSAVLIPLVEAGDEVCLVFEERAAALSAQPGDICFPGGRIEEGETPEEAAVRETCEELLLSPDDITLAGNLGPMLSISGKQIFVFAGILSGVPENYSEDEVGRLLVIPLADLSAAVPEVHDVALVPTPGADFPYDRIAGGRDYGWRASVRRELFYEWKGTTIWGMTAEMLHTFLAVIDGDGLSGGGRE